MYNDINIVVKEDRDFVEVSTTNEYDVNFRIPKDIFPSIYYLASNPQNFVTMDTLLALLQTVIPIYTDTITGTKYKLIIVDGNLEKQEL